MNNKISLNELIKKRMKNRKINKNEVDKIEFINNMFENYSNKTRSVNGILTSINVKNNLKVTDINNDGKITFEDVLKYVKMKTDIDLFLEKKTK